MKITPILSGYFKIDGGAMFGVVPKSLWSRIHPADENNQCQWAMNSILIEEGNRKILVDTGIGEKQTAKFLSHYSPSGSSVLDSLKDHMISPEEITDVFLTHLHFDHVGGAVYYNEKGESKLTFPNATHWSNKEHLEWALSPNERESASFFRENILPIVDSGQLELMSTKHDVVDWLPGLQVRHVHGHTMYMMTLYIEQAKLVYAADLLPSAYHVKMPYTLAYDLQPIKTLEEKRMLYDFCIENKYDIYLEHDPIYTQGTVIKNDQGRFEWSNLISVN